MAVDPAHLASTSGQREIMGRLSLGRLGLSIAEAEIEKRSRRQRVMGWI